MKSFYRAVTLIIATLVVVACESDSDSVFEIDATGNIAGLVFIDRNGNGTLDSQIDGAAVNVSVALVVPASQSVVARATTNASGIFIFANIPVGRYGVTVEAPTLGDSLRVEKIDSTTITVAAQDTSLTVVTLGYQQIPIAQLGSVPIGRRASIRGVALNAWSAFGDSTLHVADSTGVIRALRVQQINVSAGDTVRLLGTVARINNVLTLTDAIAFRTGTGTLTRTPVALTTAQAATADGGALRNDLVRITQASVINTQTLPNNEVLASVDDGSGLLQVVLDASGGFGNVQQSLVAGALLDATGLLVAREDGVFQLKPRGTADITIGFQRVSIAQARTLTAGRLVQIEALALNGWITYGDSTVHIVDGTGSLRTTRVAQSTLFAGDSVRMVGRIAFRDGQPVLTLVTPTVLLTNRALPAPVVVTPTAAANASGGALDAALARVNEVFIIDTATVAGDLVLHVADAATDSITELRVVIETALGLNLTPYRPGERLNVTGLLVPAVGGATWVLKPRGLSDIEVTTPPPAGSRITGDQRMAAARAAPIRRE